MKARIQPWEIDNRLRVEGYAIPANAGNTLREELGIGRYLRTPALGWVLDMNEAQQLRDELIHRYGKRL